MSLSVLASSPPPGQSPLGGHRAGPPRAEAAEQFLGRDDIAAAVRASRSKDAGASTTEIVLGAGVVAGVGVAGLIGLDALRRTLAQPKAKAATPHVHSLGCTH